jgi:putative flippase GtrA
MKIFNLLFAFAKKDYCLFIFSGGIQYIIDVSLFSAFLYAGVDVVLSNILSRTLAAIFGFLFNGFFVFGFLVRPTRAIVIPALYKFISLLFILTFLSTAIIQAIHFWWSPGYTASIAIKMLTEFLLAVLSFFAQKYVVFSKK